MLISLMTLIVFLYQTNLIRQQQYMSVLPYLEMNKNTRIIIICFDINRIKHPHSDFKAPIGFAKAALTL